MAEVTQSADLKKESHKQPSWGQHRRLEFIEYRLLWEGQINRSDLTNFFGISIPQASVDLARYSEIAPENIEYDLKAKIYKRTAIFKPTLIKDESSGYLDQLLAVTSGMLPKGLCFIGEYPDADIVFSLARRVPPAYLARLLAAIRNKDSLLISYQSMNQDEPTERRIFPHAIAYEGSRWHTRAYCFNRKKFVDFVIARITNIRDELTSEIDSNEDTEWHEYVTVVLAPHRNLTVAQSRAIALDYGMKSGVLEVKSRKAMLFYLLQRLGLVYRSIDIPPKALQLEVRNKNEIEALLEVQISDGLPDVTTQAPN